MTVNKDISRKIADIVSRYDNERKFWLNQLSGEWTKSIFPYDYAKPVVNRHGEGESRSETLEFAITGDLFEQLMRLSKRSDYTLHVILAAALAVLLAKYTGDKDIILGAPIYKQEIEADFVNTVLTLRNYVPGVYSFKEFLIQVKETIAQADKYQNYPIEQLAEDLGLKLSSPGDGFPLFDVALLVENIHDPEYIRHISHSVTFSFLRGDETIKGSLVYSSARYEKTTITRIIGHWLNLLHQVLGNPAIKIADIDILSEEERQLLLLDFNKTGAARPAVALQELFENQVETTPDRAAAVCSLPGGGPRQEKKNLHLSYRELNQGANRLAWRLREKGVQPDTIVGILTERSIEMLIGIWGILKAGGAYLPISAEIPLARKKFMLEDSAAKLLLLQGYLFQENKEIMKGLSPQQVVFIDDPESSCSEIVKGTLAANPHVPVKPYHLGYVIYTSGSTGRPKGVMLTHQGIVNYVMWAANFYTRGENLHFPLYTSFAFDLTVTSLFVPLVTGNAVVIYPEDQGEPSINQVIAENRVGLVKLTPSHLKLLVSNQVEVSGSALKGFIVGGEKLDALLAHDIYRRFNGNIALYNEYGPTETVVGSMIYLFDPGPGQGESVPIGKPIANTQIYLLDSALKSVPLGAAGELCISGHGVARGYLNQPELTAEKFKKYRSYRSNRTYILYKTGDLARQFPDGTIEFLGRKDQQVKIRAFRIELREIESKLREYRKHTPITVSRQDEKMNELQAVPLCRKCLLPANYPGIYFDDHGVCNVCLDYNRYKNDVIRYFKNENDFNQLLADIKKTGRGEYDCLLLFSGGKDSSYVLYRLIDMGLKVLTFTFDNGYISDAAFANIKRITSNVGVENIVYRTENMSRLFVESLNGNHNVCHGCWHALNTFGAGVAYEKGINLVISGLSRGQIFDMRLLGLFQRGIFAEKEIEENLLLFRKTYHSRDNKFSRILGTGLEGEIIEQIHFVDFFRYFDIPVAKIKEYLFSKGWVQPGDTGFCSSNCIINDVGIYIHFKEEGYHFYSAPLSWDCRLGSITRDDGLREIGFQCDVQHVDDILGEIGYYDSPVKDVVVIDREDKNGDKYLCAYLVSGEELSVPEMRAYLSGELPPYMIPSYFTQVQQIPLTPHGKIDRNALPEPAIKAGDMGMYLAPRNETEAKLADIWAEILGIDKEVISIDANFFNLGGHSFNATLMAGKIQKAFNITIPLREIFKTPSIQRIAELIEMMGWASGQQGNDLTNVAGNQKKEEFIL